MNAFLIAALVTTSASMVNDTTIALERGDRVRFEGISGEMVIEGWDGNELEIEDMDRDRAGVRVVREGSRVVVSTERRRGRGAETELHVRVPRWAAVEIEGRSLEVVARSLGGDLDVANVRGDILAEGVTGNVSVRTMQGEVDIIGVNGRVVASSQSDDVTLHQIRGDVRVHSADGDITLSDIEARNVEAETQDGDIEYVGGILPGGEYGFFVHDGDAIIAIPDDASARVSASTFDGEFQSDFPVRVERYTGGREFEFLIGSGDARLRIQVFDGEIRLLRSR